MDLLKSFTSTGDKFAYHPEALHDLMAGRGHPITLHIMPTERCNLRCVFCSVAHRGEAGQLYPDLRLEQIKYVIDRLKPLGLKSVVLSGGGDPTLYGKINELIKYLYNSRLQIGMITNGIMLKKLYKDTITRLSWIRISVNTLDYMNKITIPQLHPTTVLGFSYIWNKMTCSGTIELILEHIKEQSKTPNPIQYVRMACDCNLPSDELAAANLALAETVARLGPLFFHQHKNHQSPKQCHLGKLHPVFYTDGNIYPCDSLVLNSPADDKRFHQDYAMCRWTDIGKLYSGPMEGSLVDTSRCPCCVYTRQNEILTKILSTKTIPEKKEGLPHTDFI